MGTLFAPVLTDIAFKASQEAAKIRGLGNHKAWNIIIYPHFEHRVLCAWLSDRLSERGLSGCLSPLHDEDITELGHVKDPHYHLMIKSNHAMSANFALALSYCLNGGVIPAFSVSATQSELDTWLYHIHAKHPDKAQYKDEDRILFGGYVPPVGKNEQFRRMWECADNFRNVHELVRWCRTNALDLLPCVEKNFKCLKAFYGERY